MSVESLLSQMGIRYRIIDDEAVARCPYHSDNHPSWSVNLNNGLHYCFSCGAKGTIATLIRDFLGYSYAESVLMANETVGFARMSKWREDYDNVSFSPQALKVTDADMALFISPPSEALKDKNITSESAHYFGIKWNPVNNTWIFPYRDPFSGELWGWQEKNNRIFRNFPAGTKRGKTLFGYDKLRRNGAILVESPVDCAVMHSAGYEHTVSSFGAPSIYQLSLIQSKCDTLVLALDNDKAGISATRDLIYEAVRMFSSVKVFKYTTDAKDPGELSYSDITAGMMFAESALEWLRRN
jgi:DNA primase